MPRSRAISDESLLEQIQAAGADGITAAALGVPAARVRGLEGVAVVGKVETGRAGRPALLFGPAA